MSRKRLSVGSPAIRNRSRTYSVTCKIAIEHRPKQKRAGAFKRHLVDIDDDLEAAAERERTRRMQPAHDAPDANGSNPVDLTLGRVVGARRVEFEEIPQGARPLF